MRKTVLGTVVLREYDLIWEDMIGTRLAINRGEQPTRGSNAGNGMYTYAKHREYCHFPGRSVVCTVGTARVVTEFLEL